MSENSDTMTDDEIAQVLDYLASDKSTDEIVNEGLLHTVLEGGHGQAVDTETARRIVKMLTESVHETAAEAADGERSLPEAEVVR